MSSTSPVKITATIITLNEEANLPRALKSLEGWVSEIVVVDSGSTDRTREIAEKSGAKFFTNPWPGYGKQKNFAQEKASYDWVLNLDADEAVSPELAREILARIPLAETQGVVGFRMPRKTFYLGRWIRHGGWYPNALVRMARKSKSRWSEPHIHEELVVEGRVDPLACDLVHHTFDSVEDQVTTNLRYAQFGSRDLAARGQRASLLKLLLKPVGKFLETYIWKAGFLDGLPGFIISINAAHSMFLKYAFLFENRTDKTKSQ